MHPTLSDECVQFSVKKFFVDGFHTDTDVPIYFTNMYQDPEKEIVGMRHPVWIRFRFDGFGTEKGMRVLKLNTYVFSRGTTFKQPEELLASTKDLLGDYIVNIDPDGNGIASMPLLDISDKSQVSSMVVDVGQESNVYTASDRTQYQLIPIRLKWVTI